MTLFRSHGRDACPISFWDLGTVGVKICGELVPHVTFGFAGPETWPAVSRGGPCMKECLKSPLASPVLAQSWSQTATDGAWFSTTALLSGRDRPLRPCVLRPRGSKPETRCTRVWRPLSQASVSSWRALESGARPDAGCIKALMPDIESAPSAFSYVVHGQRFVGGSAT